MTCTGTICAVLPYLTGGAYIAIMLAVVEMPQLLAPCLDHRRRQLNRQPDFDIADLPHSVAELTRMASEMRQQMRNGNDNSDANHTTAAPFQ